MRHKLAHATFNAMQANMGATSNHLHTLVGEVGDPEEVKDLIRDADTLARRIDRLHHDYANSLATPDLEGPLPNHPS